MNVRSLPRSRGLFTAAFLLLAIGLPAWAGAPVTASTLAASAGTTSPAANPLSFDDGRLVFDVQLKGRVEVRDNNYDFNSNVNGPQDASWLLTRFRLGALYSPQPWLKFYIQGQDIRELGGSRPNNIGTLGADGDDVFDILKAWVEIGDFKKGLSARIGRQPIPLGDQRLMGNPEWANTSRVFDAARLHYAAETWQVDLFTASPVNFINNMWNQSDFLDNDESRNAIISGAYFSSTALVPWQTNTDFYVFHKMEDKFSGAASAGSPLGAVGDTNFWTFGTLWKGDPKKLHNWTYEMELAAQFGKVAGLDHSAFAGHAAVGYNFDHPWKPHLGLQYNYASGDRNGADGKNTTFQNLFAANHYIYGLMDTTAWMNLQNPQLNLSFQPSAKLKVTVDYNLFWNATSNDAWYRANTTTTVRPVKAGASRFRGQEFDVIASYNVNKHLALQAGYAVYLAGRYLSETGASSHAQFGYAQLQVDF